MVYKYQRDHPENALFGFVPSFLNLPPFDWIQSREKVEEQERHVQHPEQDDTGQSWQNTHAEIVFSLATSNFNNLSPYTNNQVVKFNGIDLLKKFEQSVLQRMRWGAEPLKGCSLL